jgi:outer membrane protein assembly factor BamB
LVCGEFLVAIRLIQVDMIRFLLRRDKSISLMRTSIFHSSKRFTLLSILIALLVTGCVARRDGVSWADLTVIDNDQNILVSFRDYMVIVDPIDGQPIPLLNEEGEARVDAEGNEREWVIADEGGEFYSSPYFIDDETMLVADYNNRLLTVNINSARIEDAEGFSIDGHVIVDLVTNEAGDVLYLPFSERNLVAVDAETFDTLWTFETDRGIWADLFVQDDRLYFTSIDHHFYAVDANNGDLIWDIDLGGGIASAPLFANDHFYVGTFDRQVFKVNMDGEIVGEAFETQDWVWSTPVLADNTLYVTDLSGHVYAADVSGDSFEVVWDRQVSSSGIRARPIVTDSFVIVADRDGRIHWLNREDGEPIEVEGEDGSEPLVRDVDAEILSDMLLIEWDDEVNEDNEPRQDLLIVSTVNNSRVLIAFTLEDGARRWDYGR